MAEKHKIKKSIKSTSREVRGILADMSIAETHLNTLDRPEQESGTLTQIYHLIHYGLYKSGKLANRRHERKVPAWPFNYDPSKVSVLGYGQEKVVYKVPLNGNDGVEVLSVYHIGAISDDPTMVIKAKAERYTLYEKYFGNLVLPTSFAVVDNPWGEGGKPAEIQPYVENIDELNNYSAEELEERARQDPAFGDNLRSLVNGYNKMLADGICPDLASSNIVISGSEIPIFDTGKVYSVDRLDHLQSIHSNYALVEELSNNLAF